MKYTADLMQKVITKIAEKHGADLVNDRPGDVYIKLEMGDGWQPLVIEKPYPNMISVCHYANLNGDLAQDPEIVFWQTPKGTWLPVEITQLLSGWKQLAKPDDSELGMKFIAPYDIFAEVAEFADMWAQNILDQGWLEHGKNTADS